MPFALLIVGVILLAAALRGQVGTLFSTLKSDFTGSGNFIYWIVAILLVGSIGYVKKIQPISDAFLALVMVVFFLANKGFFSQFMAGLSASTNCTSDSTSSTDTSTAGTASSQNNALFSEGQSLSTQLQNMNTNINNAFGYGNLGGN